MKRFSHFSTLTQQRKIRKDSRKRKYVIKENLKLTEGDMNKHKINEVYSEIKTEKAQTHR